MFHWVIYRPPKILKFSKWSLGGANYRDCFNAFLVIIVKRQPKTNKLLKWKINQKQPFADVFQNRCSEKIRNIHRKTSVLESLFSKLAGLKACKKRLQHNCFPVNIAKFLRTTSFIEQLWWLLLNNYLQYQKSLSLFLYSPYFINFSKFI